MKKTLLTSIVATTCMTAFSTILYFLIKRQFNEPLLLSLLYGNFGTGELTPLQFLTGYLLHYAIGFAFTGIYVCWLYKKGTKATLTSGAIYGTIAGVIGIGCWMAAFLLHPMRPAIDYALFYDQLMAAHIIFGIVMAGTYSLLQERKGLHYEL